MVSVNCRSRSLPNVCRFAPRPSARSAVIGACPGASCTEIPRRPSPANVPLLGLKPGKADTLWLLPVPETVTGKSQSVSAFPGFNPNNGTFAGDGLRGISVQEAPGQAPITADLADGRGANLHTFGNDLDLDINDGVSLSNKLMYSAGEVNCYCLFNNFAPQTLSSF